MLKRTVITLAVLLVIALLGTAAFVRYYDPPAAPTGTLRFVESDADGPLWKLSEPVAEPSSVEAALDSSEEHFLSSTGYVRARHMEVNGPEGAYEHRVVTIRGPLNEDAKTYALTVGWASRGGSGLREIRLEVTSDTENGHADERTWTVIGRADAVQRGDWETALIEEAPAPYGTRAYRVVDQSKAGEESGFTHMVPTASTWAGRLHDRIAPWPVFRWLRAGR